ncbi:hypothetical protein [Myxococcus sp. AS-1-15]|uniref:hypothetical protein n=1 Tax=Myxococcus sp. AS-1-15 TaxID=2874600 RepID=UPI001CBF7266|nr:hypothetical protein [Myxococcus sp. AS-1-15]MBZ4397158.1 hypothetical protein [Myxococcus sp. AS-1-15]
MRPASALTCPGCQAPRVQGAECPRCGIIYARAEARAARKAEEERAQREAAEQAPAPFEVDPAWLAPPELRSEVLPASTPSIDAGEEDAVHELRLRLVVVPLALLVGYLVATGSARFIVRLLTMYVHEVGHAVTAWLCGIPAIPAPWVTPTGSERWYSLAAMLAGALGFWAWRGWKLRRWDWMAWSTALLVAQAFCTLVIPLWRTEVFIVFGGDAGMLILGTLLVASFHARPGGHLHARGLRWGFVFIGALAFWDGFHTWWRARTDAEEIPFGRMEGVGLSDPSRLVEDHGWSEGDLIRRYVTLGIACLVTLAVFHGLQIWKERARLRAALRALPFLNGR